MIKKTEVVQLFIAYISEIYTKKCQIVSLGKALARNVGVYGILTLLATLIEKYLIFTIELCSGFKKLLTDLLPEKHAEKRSVVFPCKLSSIFFLYVGAWSVICLPPSLWVLIRIQEQGEAEPCERGCAHGAVA